VVSLSLLIEHNTSQLTWWVPHDDGYVLFVSLSRKNKGGMKTGKKVFCDSLSTAAFDFIEACGCKELAFRPKRHAKTLLF
jgi:hypothetical protein